MVITIRTAVCERPCNSDRVIVEVLINGVIFRTDAPSYQAACRLVIDTANALNRYATVVHL